MHSSSLTVGSSVQLALGDSHEKPQMPPQKGSKKQESAAIEGEGKGTHSATAGSWRQMCADGDGMR